MTTATTVPTGSMPAPMTLGNAPVGVQTLNPAQALKAVLAAFRAGHVPYLMGSPGIGKTAIFKLAADILRAQLVCFIGSQKDRTDMTGVFGVEERNGQKVTVSYPPSTFAVSGRVIYLFDELPNSPKDVQGAVQDAFTERRAGEFVFGPEAMIACAGNYVSDRAGAGKLQTALGSRITWLHVIPDVNAWCKWGNQVDANTGRTLIHPVELAFNRFRSDLHYTFDRNKEGPFACPRSHEKASNILYQIDENPDFTDPITGETEPLMDDTTILALLEGELGVGVAAELVAFRKIINDLTAVETIFLNPHNANIPSEVSALIATVANVSRKMTVANIDAAKIYLDRVGNDISREYGAWCFEEAFVRDKSLQHTPTATKWFEENQDMIF